MRFETEFKRFLDQVVNLSPGRLQTLRDRSATIGRVLRATDEDRLEVVDARAQGSFAQKTIINPIDDRRGFDADLLVECADRFETVADMLNAIEAALRASAPHADLVRQKTRCVTLEYAGEFHLDVVPCVTRGNGLEIGNTETGEWEGTDPDGYSEWLLRRDAHACNLLVPTIRLCKYLRDYKRRPAIKSVILSTMLADLADERDSGAYTDLPTALVLLLEDLAAWSAQFSEAPYLEEPTCSAELRLGDTDWPVFVGQVESLARRSREAYNEPDEAQSFALWRDLFGKRFPAPKHRSTQTILAPGEQDLYRDFEIPTILTHGVSMDARVRPKKGFRHGPIASRSPLEKFRTLVFELRSTTVAQPFDVYWKVKNTGPEATRAGHLRGEITPDNNGLKAMKIEPTKYAGQHYVELYVVKDGICVARARQEVPIA